MVFEKVIHMGLNYTMTRTPLVTIVTPVLNLIANNRSSIFEKNIYSVHGQSYKNIEHIIVDGASTDGTIKILQEYAHKGWIKYISQKDTCLYEAMNTGIDKAAGKYIAFLNSDDFFHNFHAIDISIDALEKNGADFSYADCDLVQDEKYICTFYGQLERFVTHMPFSHQTMFAKRSILQHFGKFDLKYKMAADYNLIIKIILGGCTSIYIPQTIATFNMGGLSSISCDLTHEDCACIYKERYTTFYTFPTHEEARSLYNSKSISINFLNSFYEFAKKNNFQNFNWRLAFRYLYLANPSKKNRLKERLYIDIQLVGYRCALLMEIGKLYQRVGNSLKKKAEKLYHLGIEMEQKAWYFRKSNR